MLDYGYYDYNAQNTRFQDVTFPLILNILLTNRCNLNCSFCCLGKLKSVNDSHGDIKLDLALKIIEECAENGVLQINYSGGEPFLYNENELLEILKKGKEYNIIQTITTNGVLLNEKKILRISQYLDSINVSLHGGEHNHNLITNSNCYQSVLANLYMASKKVRVNILYTLSKRNNKVSDIEDVIKVAKELDIKIIFARANNIGNAYENNLSARVCDIKQLLNIIDNEDIDIGIANCLPACVSDDRRYIKSCSAGVAFGSVGSSGEVKICSESKVVLGVIDKKTTLKMIWNGDKIKKFRSLSWMNSKCKSCKDFRICKGGCKAESENEFGVDGLFMEKIHATLNTLLLKKCRLNVRYIKCENNNFVLINSHIAFYIEKKFKPVIEFMIKNKNWKVKDIIMTFAVCFDKGDLSILIIDMYEKGLIRT